MKKNRTIGFIAVLISIFVIITSCYYTVKCEKGNGNIKKEERKTENFEALEISGAYDVIYTQSNITSVYIETDENILPFIISKVKGKKLIIENKDSKSLCPSKDMKIYITVPDIKNIDMSGAVDIECSQKASFSDLKINISGAGELNFNLSVQNLYIDCSGSGKINLSGNATNVNFEASGAAEINAFNFEVENYKVSSSGAGEANVKVNKKLDVEISGAGSVNYKGNPVITKDISGVGSIKKVD